MSYGGVADEAAGERHARDVGHRAGRASQRIPQAGEELDAVFRHRAALVADAEAIPVQFDLETIAETDEGVPRQALAALHAFQQEAGLERRELHERRDRRVEVARDVKMRLHAVILPTITL